ncbi:MAG: acyl-CoA thioesterase domain-containing protein, partial [Mycobacterium sp.]
MSALLRLLDVRQGDSGDSWVGPASGPEGKRAFGGQFMAQSLAAASRTVEHTKLPTNMHLQFLRGGEAGETVDYGVQRVFDGRTAAARRVEARQGGRLLTTASVSFAAPLAGPEHGRYPTNPPDPETLEQTGPAGPAPSMPLDEIDIRIDDDRSNGEFVRRLWWRVTVVVPDDPLLHTVIAAYVADVYMIDPALQVHGHSMKARTHRSGTTDSSIWFHRAVRADQWNLLETRSPAAAR